jgi:hypothetical protein
MSALQAIAARPAPALVALLALGLLGCTGQAIDGPGGRPNGSNPAGAGGSGPPGSNPGGKGGSNGSNEPAPVGPAPGVNPPGSAVRCEAEVIAPRVLRRLTGPELEATVRAAFKLDATAWTGPSLSPDPASSDGFSNNSDRLTVGDEYARRLLETAKDVAETITDPSRLPFLLPCSAAPNEACGGTFVDTFGPKLYRRPLTAAERARYVGLFGKAIAQADFKGGVYWATVALLKSPHTVYRSELGAAMAGGRFKLGPYEVASALSYAYTGGPPGPELLQLAAGNRLDTADQVEAAVRALILAPDGKAKPVFADTVMRFADQWLGLSPVTNLKKDSALFASFTPEVQTALAEEVRRFLLGVIIEDKGKPADLFLAPHTFVDSRLSAFYGFGNAGPSFIKVPRPPGWGKGLLAQGALLAVAASSNSTSPTKRGHLVRERLLCQKVPPPPPLVGKLPDPTDAETTRKRYEDLHVADPSCKGCHLLMDPIGFGLEHFDATGRYRAKEGAFDIDDSGKLVTTSLGDLDFKGADQLADAVAKLPETADCFADFVSGYTFGMDHRSAGCIARTATDELRAGTISLSDYFVRLGRAESFRVRAP